MTVINTQHQASAANSRMDSPDRGAAEDASKTSMPKPDDNRQGDTVKISGHAMLLSRLFNTKDVNADIPVVQTRRIGTPTYVFLTKDDRKMLEAAYEYTSANGMDPQYVDGLAFDLACYRMGPNDKRQQYDLDGHRLTFEFGASEAKVVDRIQNSDAINYTSIDRGFIDYTFNTLAPGHAVSFEFLEKMISVFSTSVGGEPVGSDNATSPSFTSFVPPKHDYITHVSAEAELPMPPEPDYISVNGVGRWRTPELAAAAARGASGHGRSGIDLTPYLTASNKETLTQALLSLLDNRTGETAARIRYIASMLDLPLTGRGGEKSVSDSNKNAILGVINNLNNFLDNTGTQDAFDAENFLKLVFSQKINTSV